MGYSRALSPLLSVVVKLTIYTKRTCAKCRKPHHITEMQQNKMGNVYRICKKCFSICCSENSKGRAANIYTYIRDYTPKKTIEPCTFCAAVTSTNKFYKSLNLTACDACYSNLNRVCGHVTEKVLA